MFDLTSSGPFFFCTCTDTHSTDTSYILYICSDFHAVNAVQFVQMEDKEVGMHIIYWTDKLLIRLKQYLYYWLSTDNVIIEDD